MSTDWQDALARARENAPFLARALERQAELTALLEAGQGEAALACARQAGEGADDLGIALRRERLALATTLAIGDLAGAFALERVMEELSALADRALDRAIAHAITQRTQEEAKGFFALALGKHGACELNYSSDIDPILLFDPGTIPHRGREEPVEAAQHYAHTVVRLLSQNTGEGYVFRVDLRLRPAAEVSPPALSIPSALTHYQSAARAWERAALIKARVAAGDKAAGEAMLDELAPFIWRTALDFGAVEEVRALTRRIRKHHESAQDIAPGYNVKLGRGGIREIEFFAQTHQLIHGGRDPSVRVRGTRAALGALAEAGHIDPQQAAMLSAAYTRLRVIEHRLQMVGDQQTHTLPQGEALEQVARLDGLANAAALIEELEQITRPVARAYDALIAEDKPQNRLNPDATGPLTERLAQLGFAQPQKLERRISAWRDGRYQSLRSPAALAAFDAMLPALLEALSDALDKERALARWESVLANASSAINLFRLLEARPQLFRQLMAILTLAPPLADELGQRPQLLDPLVDGSAGELPGSVEELGQQMRCAGESPAYEDQLDRIRLVASERRFGLGVQLIEAAHDPLDIARGYSRIAEAALHVAHDAARCEFERAHGRIEGAELMVLGLGRLGGGMLTYASDLDIIYLFTGAFDTQSDGQRPLSATAYFNRLAQRVSAALSVPTAQGALYEVDTRLRPQGAQGLLAVTVSNFAKYQLHSAWSWEHMALTRARVLLGSPQSRQELHQNVQKVLILPRETTQLCADAVKMRTDMATHKPARGLLDVKQLRGGLVDLEFIVQFLQLSEHQGLHPDLGAAIDALIDARLLPAEIAEHYALLSRALIGARLLAPDLAEPAPAAASALAKACRAPSFDQLLHNLTKTRHEVAQLWHAHMGEKLELE